MAKSRLSVLPLDSARAPGPRSTAGAPLEGGHGRINWALGTTPCFHNRRGTPWREPPTTGQHHKAQSPTGGQPGPRTGDQRPARQVKAGQLWPHRAPRAAGC